MKPKLHISPTIIEVQFVWKEKTLCLYHLFKNDDIDEVKMKKVENHSSKHFFQIKERLIEMSFLVSIIVVRFLPLVIDHNPGYKS